MITTGAVQSNHARMTAAAACIAGMRCVLVLTRDQRSPPIAGNLLLDKLLRRRDPARARDRSDARGRPGRGGRRRGRRARNRRGPDAVRDSGRRIERRRRVRLRRRHRGARRQLAAMRASRRHACITPAARAERRPADARRKAVRAPYALYGVAVSAGEPEKIERAKRIANEAAACLTCRTARARRSLHRSGLHRRRLRHPDAAALESIELLARTEAILLDPCLHVEGHGGPDRSRPRRRDRSPTDTVVFLHTGGMPALFTREFVCGQTVGR